MTDARNEIRTELRRLGETFTTRAAEVIDLLVASGISRDEAERSIRPRAGRAASPLPASLLSMDGVTRHPLTPQLEERFRYAGDITDLAWKLLSVSSIEKQTTSSKLASVFRAQKEDWDGSAPMVHPSGRISLFATANIDDGDVAYLVWPDSDTPAEPEVWTYLGQTERRHRDILAFIRTLNDS